MREYALRLSRWEGGMKYGFALAALLAVSMETRQACAQSDQERAAARAIAQRGIQAAEEGRYAEAANLLERAESVVHAPTHLLYLARVYEKQGKLVKSREIYLKLKREELPPNASKAFRKARVDGEKELAALEPRLSFVTIVVRGTGGVARVTEDGVPISASLLGLSRPTDPGVHRYEAQADGFEPASGTLTVREGSNATIELTLKQVPSKSPPSKPGSAALVSSASVGSPESLPEGGQEPAVTYDSSRAPAEGSGSGLRTAGYISLGVGAAAAAAGTYFLIRGVTSQSDANQRFDACNPGCTSDQEAHIRSLDESASKQKTVAGITLAGAGAGIAAGVVMLLLPTSSTTEAGRLRPWVSLGSAGIVGEF